MNRRKASTERNSKHRTSSKRPSMSNLDRRQHVLQQRLQKPEKLPSTHNVVPDTSIKMVSKAVDVCVPKTRFNSQDRCREIRSCSSPRLKYFPAEKIKKLESPPPFSPTPMGALIAQQDHREPGVLYVAGYPEERCDNGQGDAAIAQNLQPIQHQHGMQTASQQQVPTQQAIQHIDQMNPLSECTLPHQAPNLQAHRPCVPRDYPLQKTQQINFSNPPQGSASPQPVGQKIVEIQQEIAKPEDHTNGTEADYEKQPIGGRNAAAHRQIMAGKLLGQPRAQIPMDSGTINQTAIKQQPIRNQYGAHSNVQQDRSPQNPQQIYQQLQQNLAQQQQMQQRAMNYQMYAMNNQQPMNGGQAPGYYYNNQQVNRNMPVQGMISPQNATANQLRNTKMTTPVQNSTNHQNGWIRNNQMTDYSNVLNGNQPSHGLQNNHHQQQQFTPAYQHQPVHQPHQLCKNLPTGNTIQQRQQNTMAQNQLAFNQHMVPDQQFNHQGPVDSNQEDQTMKKTSLKFTTGMIRDQEKLLATMKQQGIPMEIMMRQFETMLNEQRRHLEYLEQIRQNDCFPENGEAVTVTAPRKREPENGKPEWMLHLTPPRLSYVELERLREKRSKEHEVQNSTATQQQGTNEIPNQQVTAPVTNQQNYQAWQQPNSQYQQRAPQQYGNIFNQPCTDSMVANANESLSQPNYEQAVPQYQYVQQQSHRQPAQQPIQPHFQQHYNPQQYQQFYQAVPQQIQEQVQAPNHHQSFPVREATRSQTAPSSLLKLRLYRTQIRPQRRNNGLQDPEIAKRHLEQLKLSAESKKGLEYLVNLALKKPTAMLNGMQDRTDVEAEFQHRLITSNYQAPAKKIAANGLENARNPNNPPPQKLSIMKKMEQEYLNEYPRQKQDKPRSCYNFQAERENGSVAMGQQQILRQQQFPKQASAGMIPCNERNPMMTRASVLPYKFEGHYPQHYQQMQQYNQNTKSFAGNIGDGDVASAQRIEQGKGTLDRAGGDTNENTNGGMNGQTMVGKMPYERAYYSQPNIHETRTIGGVRYLARKQDYLRNQQIVSPETLIASRYLQPPMVY